MKITARFTAESCSSPVVNSVEAQVVTHMISSGVSATSIVLVTSGCDEIGARHRRSATIWVQLELKSADAAKLAAEATDTMTVVIGQLRFSPESIMLSDAIKIALLTTSTTATSQAQPGYHRDVTDDKWVIVTIGLSFAHASHAVQTGFAASIVDLICAYESAFEFRSACAKSLHADIRNVRPDDAARTTIEFVVFDKLDQATIPGSAIVNLTSTAAAEGTLGHFFRQEIKEAKTADASSVWTTFGEVTTTGVTINDSTESDDDDDLYTALLAVSCVAILMFICCAAWNLTTWCGRESKTGSRKSPLGWGRRNTDKARLFYNGNQSFSLAVRSGPALWEPPIAVIEPNERVTVLKMEGEWCKLQAKSTWGDGKLKVAWARKDAVDSSGVVHEMLKPVMDAPSYYPLINAAGMSPVVQGGHGQWTTVASMSSPMTMSPIGTMDDYLVTEELVPAAASAPSPAQPVHFYPGQVGTLHNGMWARAGSSAANAPTGARDGNVYSFAATGSPRAPAMQQAQALGGRPQLHESPAAVNPAFQGRFAPSLQRAQSVMMNPQPPSPMAPIQPGPTHYFPSGATDGPTAWVASPPPNGPQ